MLHELPAPRHAAQNVAVANPVQPAEESLAAARQQALKLDVEHFYLAVLDQPPAEPASFRVVPHQLVIECRLGITAAHLRRQAGIKRRVQAHAFNGYALLLLRATHWDFTPPIRSTVPARIGWHVTMPALTSLLLLLVVATTTVADDRDQPRVGEK